jgi:histidinol-phosphatase
MMTTFESYLQFAVETSYEAGKLTLGYFNRGIQPDFKTDDSPVTIADREAEKLIRQRIEKRFPNHGIVGEEFGEKGAAVKDFCWYIDPIDGTKSFIRGVPLYGVLLGLEINARVEVGAAYFPGIDEMVCAASGTGTFLNGRRVHVLETEKIAKSMVGCTDSYNFELQGSSEAWNRIKQATYYRSGWSDAFGHALVATGRLEIMVDPIMHPWDCGPFPVILREAGGYFGDWKGNETIHTTTALSTTQKLLPQVLEILNHE